MIWKGTYTAIMALWAWIAIGLIVTGMLQYFDLFPWGNDTTFTLGWMMLLGIIPIRIAVFFIDLIMTAFGLPLIYEIRIDQVDRP